MDARSQFCVFGLCVAVGFCGGILYEVFAVGRKLCGVGNIRKIVDVIFDVLFCLAFCVICVATSAVFRFPDFRIYMWLGYALGGIIYLKSLHRIVAFVEKICYNILRLKAKGKKKLFEKGEEDI